jgi:hypothetical protein
LVESFANGGEFWFAGAADGDDKTCHFFLNAELYSARCGKKSSNRAS